MSARTVWQALLLPPWRFLASRWPWVALVFAVTSALLALVLIPVLIATVLLLPLWGMLLAIVERRRLRLLGLPAVSSGHVRVLREERRNWLNIRLMEPATWRETGSLLMSLILGALTLAALFMQVLALAVLIAIPWMATRRTVQINLFGDAQITLGNEAWWYPLLILPIALLIFAYVNAALAAIHGACSRWLISPRAAEIDQRVEQLTRSRAAIVNAHESERQRIERDLHDGVQQELVGIAARLGILELELRSGTDEARDRALRAAQAQTERALDSLRATVRGIHPAILADHGLPAALEELAGRSAVPLVIDDHGFGRLDPAAEAAGYFFVAEALTNTAKHTTASNLIVTLFAEGSQVRVEARDDGHGGVDLARGTGLRGLAERVDALGGGLVISSPPGGPTVLTLTLPETTRRGFTEVPNAHSSR